ncbi:unnamed protein product [Penicillium bialowiezense]
MIPSMPISKTNIAQPKSPNAHATLCVLSSKPAELALGNLAVLPTEVLFKILDEILWAGPYMTHESFCAISRLMTTNKALEEVVRSWVMGRKILVHKEPFSDRNDLITGTIRDGCLDCFNLIRDILPEDDKFPDNLLACINEQGWSFWSLAVHAGAWIILSVHKEPVGLTYVGDLD